MGKKSKKKGGATNKAARKEKLQERREQQLEEVDNNQGSNDLVPRQYFEGDRVWFLSKDNWDDPNPNNCRGIVKHVKDDSLDIIPFQSKLDGHNQSITALLNNEKHSHVFPDFCDMTLRFDVGDRVLCAQSRGWTPKEVSYLWPIAENLAHGYPIPQKPNDIVLLSYNDLLLFAEENNCDDLAGYISRGKQWLKDMSCADPATLDLLLTTASL